jgi:hypothetical protein
LAKNDLLESLRGLCDGADDARHFVDVEGYLELVRPREDGEVEPLGLAAAIDLEDDKPYLVLRVHLDPAVLGAERVDADQVVQAAADFLAHFFDDKTEFLVTDLDCYGDADEDDILRLLEDEDLDGDSPVPVELFAVQMSPAQPLPELGNDRLRRLVLAAPLELMGELVESSELAADKEAMTAKKVEGV